MVGPMSSELILAIDQGTSSTKAMLVDRQGRVVNEASVPLGQTHPEPGWVEQDADLIWSGVQESVRSCVSDDLASRVVGLALSVQRETVVLWERVTGQALGPALSWQDQRTASRAHHLEAAGHGPLVFSRTGLPLDPMFSALKGEWLLDRFDPERLRSSRGELCLGTIDAWLLACLSGHAERPVTEVGNASRTQLLGIDAGSWDSDLLDLFGIPVASLPDVVSSVGPFPAVRGLAPLEDGLPVVAVMADSHAALFAHAGWRPAVVKATYGTGSSVMALGPRAAAGTGVCSTVAWQVEDRQLALEANIRSSGRTLTWLADLLGKSVDELFDLAADATSDGVSVVPAFGGLGAPHWDRDAVPLISGLSLGTGADNLARAAVESVALQVDDVLTAFTGIIGSLAELSADGGMTRSAALMQLQADLSGVPVSVSSTANLSALGAAHLAGLQLGWWGWSDLEDRSRQHESRRHEPTLNLDKRTAARGRWAQEIARSRGLSSELTRNREATP